MKPLDTLHLGDCGTKRPIRYISMFSGIECATVAAKPLMGIGSVGYIAIEEGRDAIGFELKESYHAHALRNCAKAAREWERKQRGGGLFAALENKETK